MAVRGLPFKATGAAAGTAATIYDPTLRTAITTLPIRGNDRKVQVLSCTYNSDAPGLGSHATVNVGNDGVDRYVFDMFPNLDGDLATQPVFTIGLSDMGGFDVTEGESIVITVYDPGAAELTSGVLYLRDSEDIGGTPVPGRIVTLSFGGTNDAGTTITTTGGDKPTVKLETNYNYGVIGGVVRAEDKVCEVNILADANGRTCTLPGQGKVIFPEYCMVFSGEQWNNGSVNQYLAVQAATKVETIYYCVEFNSGKETGAEKPISSNPASFPGQPNIPTGPTGPATGGSGFQSFGGFKLFGG